MPSAGSRTPRSSDLLKVFTKLIAKTFYDPCGFSSLRSFHAFTYLDLEDQMLEKYDISEDDFDILEELVQLFQPYKAGKPWQFAGSFYYATTVLTTIGK